MALNKFMSTNRRIPADAATPSTHRDERDALLPDEPPQPSAGSERSRGFDNLPTDQPHLADAFVGPTSSPEPPPSLSGRPSEAGHWYSGHFSDDERETDIARATDFGEPPTNLDLGSADRAVLLRMEGVEAGRVYSLSTGPARLGRHPDNECVIDDAGISRFHAVIKWERGAHIVEDLQSRNGTFVKGERTSRATLRDGDLLQLGPKVGLRYSFVDDQQETLLKRLYDSSNRDALTGAYNRKHYSDRLAAEVAYAERHRTEVSIIMLDIDHFKQVNDTLGHAAGDALLRQLANTVLRQLRTEDVFARVGGEEFVVILRGIPLVGAARLAERLRATVAALPAMYNGHAIPVTISLGCASLNELKRADVHDFAVLADARLYAAKQAGRNRVVAKGHA